MVFGFFDEDQLYHLQRDPKERKNLAYKNAHATRLAEMRNLMQYDLEVIGRPFGEFIPGSNTAEPGQIDKQIEIVKQLEIKGKKVTVPRALRTEPGVPEEPAPDDKTKKKVERAARKKARQKAKSNSQNNSGPVSSRSEPALSIALYRVVLVLALGTGIVALRTR